MDQKMMQEILDDWNSWKYDILDMNRSDWTKDDQLILETIDKILRNELNKDIEISLLESQIKLQKK